MNHAGLTRIEYWGQRIQKLEFVKNEMHPGRYHYTDLMNKQTVDIDPIPERGERR